MGRNYNRTQLANALSCSSKRSTLEDEGNSSNRSAYDNQSPC